MNAKMLTAACAAACAAALWAAPAAAKKPKPTAEELEARRAAAAREEYLRTGGELKQPGTQKGAFRFVNAQTNAAVAVWIRESAAHHEGVLHVGIEVADGTFAFPAPVPPPGAPALYVVDDPALPMSLVAPEAMWAVVNAAALAEARPQFFRARLKKEISRVFAQLAGALSSQFRGSLMGPVREARDLDYFEDDRLPIDVVSRFTRYLEKMGVNPYRLATYDMAVQEGWAPAPTNDVQRAVRERVEKWMSERGKKR